LRKNINAVTVIIAINVLVFLVRKVIANDDAVVETFALYFPENEKFQVWQLVTNMFMHGGFAHLVFNMYGLYAFGSLLEQLWGTKRFVLFYFLCGIGASAIYLLVNYYKFHALIDEFVAKGIDMKSIMRLLETSEYDKALFSAIPEEQLSTIFSIFNYPALGASGAIYGVLVAFGMMFPNVKLMLIFLPVPIPAKFFIPALVALDLFSGVTGVSIFGGGIAHFAHIGGALIGFLLMLYWRNKINRGWQVVDESTHSV
jgi:membrane associated rhomboid family serine protease